MVTFTRATCPDPHLISIKTGPVFAPHQSCQKTTNDKGWLLAGIMTGTFSGGLPALASLAVKVVGLVSAMTGVPRLQALESELVIDNWMRAVPASPCSDSLTLIADAKHAAGGTTVVGAGVMEVWDNPEVEVVDVRAVVPVVAAVAACPGFEEHEASNADPAHKTATGRDLATLKITLLLRSPPVPVSAEHRDPSTRSSRLREVS